GVFPSIDAAWAISNEDFMKGITWISNLKLRGGWGEIGNQDAIGDYTSQYLFGPLLNNGTPILYYNGALGQFVSASGSVQNQNLNLRWQVENTTDIGIDFSLFNGRLNGSFDWYSKTTNHLLYTYAVPT